MIFLWIGGRAFLQESEKFLGIFASASTLTPSPMDQKLFFPVKKPMFRISISTSTSRCGLAGRLLRNESADMSGCMKVSNVPSADGYRKFDIPILLVSPADMFVNGVNPRYEDLGTNAGFSLFLYGEYSEK